MALLLCWQTLEIAPVSGQTADEWITFVSGTTQQVNTDATVPNTRAHHVSFFDPQDKAFFIFGRLLNWQASKNL